MVLEKPISDGVKRMIAQRHIRSLDDEEWKRLVSSLRRGPTKKQREIMAKAQRVAKQLRKNR